MRKLLFLIPLLFVFTSGQQLLVNGDFEQDLSNGWVMFGEGTGTHYADRATDYQPDPDYEAYTYQWDNPGSMLLSQTVDAPGIQLVLSFQAAFAESGGTSSCWPAPCFQVCYLSAVDVVLGQTRYYLSTYANWVPNDTLSLVRVYDSNWNQYTLDIADELSRNLPGVNPGDVAKVRVGLYSYTYSG